MPPAATEVVFDQANTTYLILSTLAALVALATLMHVAGLLGWLIGIGVRLFRGVVRLGFRTWALVAVPWPVVLLVGGIAVAGGLIAVRREWESAAILAANLLMLLGLVACLAYIHLSFERAEVARGHKAVHNPSPGQALAADLARYGPKLGVPMLAASAVVAVAGFALLNFALFESFGRDWYALAEPDSRPGYLDFLAYGFLHLLRVIDLLDLARTYHYLNANHIHPAAAPARLLLLAFKSFVTVVVLQQIFAAVREARALSDAVADACSPHPPIRDRALDVLPQFGPAVVRPVLRSLRDADELTREQRDRLPRVLADVGPAAAPALIRHLRDRYAPTRGIAAAALGLLKVRDAIPRLIPLTRDPSDAVRVAAVEALGATAAEHVGKPQPSEHGWRKWNPFRGSADFGNRAVMELRSALADASSVVRAQAAIGLGRIGSPAAAATAELIGVLTRDEDEVRPLAAEALGRVGDKSALEPLRNALADPVAEVRAAAAAALGEFGPTAGPALTPLTQLLLDETDAVRTAAAAALPKLGAIDAEALTVLTDGLRSGDNLVRARAAESLGAIGPAAAPAADALVAALSDANDRVRAKAAEALQKIGAAAGPAAVARLARLLHDEDNWVRAVAADALGEMGPGGENAAPALRRSLRHANALVRLRSATSLGKLRVTDARADLEHATADADAGVRAAAIRSLARLGRPTATTQQAATALVSDSVPEVRAAVAEALGEWVGDWPGAVDALEPLVGDVNDAVSVAAMDAAANAATVPESLIAAVVSCLGDDHANWVRESAARALAKWPESRAAAAEALTRAAKTGDAAVREAALRTLAAVRPDGTEAAFVTALAAAEAEVRRAAVAGLARSSELSDTALAAIVTAVADADSLVRTGAARVLARLDPLPEEAVGPLVVALTTDAEDAVRYEAAVALRKVPTPGAKAALRSLLDDPNEKLRDAAEKILRRANAPKAA